MVQHNRLIAGRRPSRLEPNQRNVVLIITDDEKHCESDAAFLRADMDAFYADGIKFTNARAVQGLCQPSRFVMSTGQYQQNNGCDSNLIGEFDDVNLSKMIYKVVQGTANDRLVQTAHVGKAWGPSPEPGWNLPYPSVPGMDYFTGFNYPVVGSPQTSKYNWQATIYEYDYDGTQLSQIFSPVGASPPVAHSTLPYSPDWIADQAIIAIDKFANRSVGDPRRGLPFLLSVGINCPHYPVDAPNNLPPTSSPYARNRATRMAAYNSWIPPFFDTVAGTEYQNIDTDAVQVQGSGGLYSGNPGTIVVDERERMKSMVAADDVRVAIENKLIAEGYYDDTVFIYVSDNGYARGEHGSWDGKNDFYDESLRITMGIRGPGFPSNVVSNAFVSNLDLAKTICSILNITPEVEGLYVMDNGIDLSVIESAAQDALFDTRVLGLCKGRAIISDTVAYGVMNARYKLWYTSNDLFDLQNDPWELTDQHTNPTYATILSDLQALRTTMRTCSGTGCDQLYPVSDP